MERWQHIPNTTDNVSIPYYRRFSICTQYNVLNNFWLYLVFQKNIAKRKRRFYTGYRRKTEEKQGEMSGKMEGTGIPTETDRTFEFSVLPYTCHEIESAEHIFELPASYATVLRILDMQTGVGGDESWGAWDHEPYIVKGEEPRSFTFQVHLLGRGKGCIHSRFRKECQTRKNVRLLQTKKGFL